MATLTEDGWATVVRVTSPIALLVENAAGERFGVVHIGIAGPTEDQGDWRKRATEVHGRLLGAGTRVLLMSEPSLRAPYGNWTLRHVLREPNRPPVAGELLRAGAVWVFPDAIHAFVWDYADLQAEAVKARAGAWAETGSSTVYRPRGAEHGGFPINPQVVPALRALDANGMGNALLNLVNYFPVEIGVSALGPGTLGYFRGDYYTIQLNSEIMSAAPESIAAVLIHELVHANQMIQRRLDHRRIDCYEGEVEAFETAALYWFGVHGYSGKRRPTHWVDKELNETLREYASGQLEMRVYLSYGHQCGAG